LTSSVKHRVQLFASWSDTLGPTVEVELPDGSSAYTRDGSFRKGPDGLIVTAEGFPLVPEITVPEDARQISVTGEGVVSRPRSG